MKKYTLVVLITLLFVSCEIVQETQFEENGSGRYSLGFDMSEMMKMGSPSKSKDSNSKEMDTIIHFADLLELKKDSISKLSKKEQKKLEDLKNFSLFIKTDSVNKKFEMRIDYNFKDLEDLKLFGEKLKGQNIKELSLFNDKINKKNAKGENSKGLEELTKSFETTFNKHRFTSKISKKALDKAEKKKDTSMTPDNPMVNMMRFKVRYLFPYRIKHVDNKNARILSNFKGVEISTNLYELNNNPRFFDLEIEFDN